MSKSNANLFARRQAAVPKGVGNATAVISCTRAPSRPLRPSAMTRSPASTPDRISTPCSSARPIFTHRSRATWSLPTTNKLANSPRSMKADFGRSNVVLTPFSSRSRPNIPDFNPVA